MMRFPKSSLYFTLDEKELQHLGFNLSKYEKIPFRIDEWGHFVIDVKTSLGTLSLGLDTGATISAIKSQYVKDEKLSNDDLGNPIFMTSLFTVGSISYGNTALHLFPFTQEISMDGVLGMDFLRNHSFYIDYPNEVVYFQMEKSS